MGRDLTPLFEPRGVVVTGVSSHPGKFGFVTLHNLLSCGYEGKVFAVAREPGTILDHPVLTSVDEIPKGAADLLVVCTPVSANEQIIRQAADRGVRAVFVTAGGYSEASDEGAVAEARLVALTNELGLVLAGPNGQGITSPPVGLCAQIVAPFPPRGRIGVASQSGNFVSAFQNYAGQTGIGISRSVSAGNSAATGIAGRPRRVATAPSCAQPLPASAPDIGTICTLRSRVAAYSSARRISRLSSSGAIA